MQVIEEGTIASPPTPSASVAPVPASPRARSTQDAPFMPKPLHSESAPAPHSLQFKHFGILQAGQQSKTSVLTAATINIILAIALVIIGAATTKVIEQKRRVALLVSPIIVQPVPEVVRPRLVPPKIKPPVLPKLEVPPPPTPLPEVRLPDPPKPVAVKPAEPVPVNKPAPPKAVVAPPAPRPVSLAHPEAASVVNNSPRPSAVSLGRTDNPIAASNRPATAAVNLGQAGAPGMNAGNNGAGPRSAVVNLGSGSPSGQNLTGNGARAIQGVALGRPNGSGPLDSTGRNPATAGQVNLGMVQQPAMPKPSAVSVPVARTGPKVLFKPRPDYTPEARALHLEGTVSVRLHVSAAGVVTVLGIGNGLGHGLDESARRAVQATRFQPAVDASGHPTEWDGVVNVVFQIAE